MAVAIGVISENRVYEGEELSKLLSHDSVIETAWAAGFFDGEGCTSVQYGVPVIGVKQKDLGNLERFLRAVGEGKIYGPYQHKGETCETFVYRASGFCAKRVFDKLEPVLGPLKKAQFHRRWSAWQPIEGD